MEIKKSYYDCKESAPIQELLESQGVFDVKHITLGIYKDTHNRCFEIEKNTFSRFGGVIDFKSLIIIMDNQKVSNQAEEFISSAKKGEGLYIDVIATKDDTKYLFRFYANAISWCNGNIFAHFTDTLFGY